MNPLPPLDQPGWTQRVIAETSTTRTIEATFNKGKMTKDKLSESYWLGYLSGIINGMSMRHDVSYEVRDICKKVIEEYKKQWDEKDEFRRTSP